MIGFGLKNGKNIENQIPSALAELKILSKIQVKEAKTLINRASLLFSS